MPNPDFLNPAIEVIAQSPRLDMIKARLKAAGLRPYNERKEEGNIDPVLIDATSIHEGQLIALKRKIARGMGRPVVVLSEADIPHLQDVIKLYNDAELSNVPARLEVLHRKQNKLHEVKLRAQTAQEIAGMAISTFDDEPAEVLFIGNGSSRFLALTAAMKSYDVKVTAALTGVTACDYLSQRNFTCVLVDADEESHCKTSFLQDFRADYLLASIPVFAMYHTCAKRTTEQERLLLTATEVIESDKSIMEVADTISCLAEYHKAATPFSSQGIQDYRIQDRTTGLFTAEYLERHLENQMCHLAGTLSPLCFMTVQLSSSWDGDAAARKALPELAQILASELRQSDCAARMDWTTLGVSLRGTPYSGAVQLCERISRRLEHDKAHHLGAFDFTGDLVWRVVEKRKYHSAQELIRTCMTGPQTRLIRAA